MFVYFRMCESSQRRTKCTSFRSHGIKYKVSHANLSSDHGYWSDESKGFFSDLNTFSRLNTKFKIAAELQIMSMVPIPAEQFQ